MIINKHLVFDDLYSFWQYAFQESRAHEKESRSCAKNWNGNISWERTKDLALQGWNAGLDEIDKVVAIISPQITDKMIKQVPEYSVAGYSIDVGRYLSNDPECFRISKVEENIGAGRIITLVVSIGCSSSISPETITQKGAMVCALVDALEYIGNRVEVICNSASSYCSDDSSRKGLNKERGWIEIDITLKKPNQPLDMVELAFCLAHPAMFRRMIFSVRELEGWSDLVPGYGYSSKATNSGDIYIAEIFSGKVTNEKAIDWVLEQLKNLGVAFENIEDVF